MAKDKSVQIADEPWLTAKKAAAILILMYIAACAVRIVCAFLYRDVPTIIIDESLYTNIARSLAENGTLAYRGQPINYPYLFYPLLLTPLYKLFHGTDIYRAVQVYNTILMVTSIFPAYLFAKDFTGDRLKALGAAFITALMPDMILGAYLMTECVIWPLALWMIFFAYRAYSHTTEKRWGYCTALFTGLMFCTKPGAVAAGAVLLIMRIVIAARAKEQQQLIHAVGAAAALLAIVGAMYAIYLFGFGYSDSIVGLYDKQTSDWNNDHLIVAIEALIAFPFTFAFSCCGIFAVMPFGSLKCYDKGQRNFVLCAAGGVAAVMAGTAILVVPYGWDGSFTNIQLHMRYLAMFVPMFFTFTMALDRKKKTISKGVMIAMAVFLVLILFPGVRFGVVQGESTSADSMILSAFLTTSRLDSSLISWVVSGLVLLVGAFVAYCLPDGFGRMHRLISMGLLAVVLVINNVCGYIHADFPVSQGVLTDAQEINQVLENLDGEAFAITSRKYNNINTYWLESRLRKPLQQVTVDNIVVEMNESNGVYTPFVPVDQSPNLNNGLTPDTDTIILGYHIASHLELSDSVTVQETTNGTYTVATITPGERWLDTIMYGLNDNTLSDYGSINIYTDDVYDADGMLTLKISAYGSGTLRLTCGETTQDIELTSTNTMYTVRMPKGKITMEPVDGDVKITSYSTGSGE